MRLSELMRKSVEARDGPVTVPEYAEHQWLGGS